MIGDLGLLDWTLLVVAAALVGFAKTSVGGVASISVVIFAVVLPAKLSTGALLPLLIAGDVVAVSVYRRHGHLSTLLRLLPGVVPGLLVGAVFLRVVPDRAMGVTIGLILLGLGAIQLWQRRSRVVDQLAVRGRIHPVWPLLVGVVAGFATMTANAAGPVMTIYLIMAGLPMLQMLGTGAWFFLVVNLLKVPLSAGLDLITLESIQVDAMLLPAMLVGAWVGAKAIKRMQQRTFEVSALTVSMLAAALLVIGI